MKLWDWSYKNWLKLSCYFCERIGDFERTKFTVGRMPEVACLKCKHLIAKFGGVDKGG